MHCDLYVLLWYYTVVGVQVLQSINLCSQLHVPKGNIASLRLTLCTLVAPECWRIITHLAASTCISIVVEVIILSFSHVEEPFSWMHDSFKSGSLEQLFIF